MLLESLTKLIPLKLLAESYPAATSCLVPKNYRFFDIGDNLIEPILVIGEVYENTLKIGFELELCSDKSCEEFKLN